MPITKESYEKGMYYTNLEVQIEELLRKNPGMAYSIDDVIEALDLEKGRGFFADLTNYITVQSSLNGLVEANKLGSKIIRGQVFYSAL